MSLAPGTRLGSYEIEGMLGAGGMGEVYRARDTRLDRFVAIKVLPGPFASDPERRQRFEREARVVASLSHPHICALHDVGAAAVPGAPDLVEYLVMEYLDGETLAARTARGALPLPEVIRIGCAIASALEAAHRRLIVHRDLKPANIMLSGSGVKLLDFGLAKAFVSEAAGVPMLTTMSAGATSPGVLLGTVPYMAPEQIEGREPDNRADIFALGAVLYEMATGRRAFPGENPAAVAAAILSAEPPPIAASPSLDRLVRGCLRKNPDERWHSAQDVALQLLDSADRDRERAVRPARSSRLPWAVAAASLLIAAVAVGSFWRVEPPRPLRFSVPLSQPETRLTGDSERVAFALSPDGLRVAYTAGTGGTPPAIWIRAWDSETAVSLPGTDGATSVFWSPDGKSLGFFADDKLKRVDLTGSAPVTLCEAAPYVGQTGTWGDGQILFASVQGEQLFSVPVSGGPRAELRRPDMAAGERRLIFPSFLPDGRRYLYLSSRDELRGAIMLASLDGGAPREVLAVRSNAQFVEPGFILYGVDGVLLARRFDAGSGLLSGEPIPLTNTVRHSFPTGLTQFSAARTGAVSFHSGLDTSRVSSIDRIGRRLAEIRPAAVFQDMRLSRDGAVLLLDRHEPRTNVVNVWKYELARGVESRLTSESAAGLNAVLASDGSMIFSAMRGAPPQLLRRPPSGPDQALAPGQPGMQIDADLSPDGAWVLYSQRSAGGSFHLNAVALGTGNVAPFHHSDKTELSGRFSPDGHHVAFASDASGRFEVYIAPFPGPGPAQIVSAAGGNRPHWSPDGRSLFFISSDGTLYMTSVATSPLLQIGRPQPLFTTGARGRWITFEPTRDGGFLALEPVSYGAEQPLNVILNWR